MQKKRIAWQRDIYFGEKIPCVNRAAELVRLLYAVSAEVSMNPQLYATRDKVLWAYFEHSCFEAEAFLEEYGVVMALISQGSPPRGRQALCPLFRREPAIMQAGCFCA